MSRTNRCSGCHFFEVNLLPCKPKYPRFKPGSSYGNHLVICRDESHGPKRNTIATWWFTSQWWGDDTEGPKLEWSVDSGGHQWAPVPFSIVIWPSFDPSHHETIMSSRHFPASGVAELLSFCGEMPSRGYLCGVNPGCFGLPDCFMGIY